MAGEMIVEPFVPPAEEIANQPEALNGDAAAEQGVDKSEEKDKDVAPAEDVPEKKKQPTPKSTVKKAAKPAEAPAAPADGRVRRDRKQTQQVYEVEAKKTEEFVIKQGKGSKLRDIPNAAFKLSKISGKDETLETLHNVLYRRKGTAHGRKKAILDFSGFTFDSDANEKEIEARKASLSKVKLETIHKLMDTLDIPRGSGDKAAKVDVVTAFLEEPKALSDKDLASKEAAKKAKEKAKREREKARKEKTKEKKEKAAKRKATGDKKKTPAKKAKKEEASESEESEHEESESEEEQASDFEEEVVPKKKPAKSPPKSVKKTKAEPMETDDADKEEEGPAAAVKSAELKKVLHDIMDGLTPLELGKFTRNNMVDRATAHYGFNMRPRKKELGGFAAEWLEAHPERQEAAAKAVEEEAAAGGDAE